MAGGGGVRIENICPAHFCKCFIHNCYYYKLKCNDKYYENPLKGNT